MQDVVISHDQLSGLMRLLKESLAFFDKKCYPKVAFFNDWCLYRHIRSCNVPELGKKKLRTNIGALLDILEPYIPFKLSEENFDLFMEAVMAPEEEQFTHKAKMDFCLALHATKSQEQWEEAVEVCESIRSLREKLS